MIFLLTGNTTAMASHAVSSIACAFMAQLSMHFKIVGCQMRNIKADGNVEIESSQEQMEEENRKLKNAIKYHSSLLELVI
jgi:hypothetical protein